jgi:hypothetical protein
MAATVKAVTLLPDVAVLIVGMQQDASEDRNIEIVLSCGLFIIAIRQPGNLGQVQDRCA